MNDNLNKFQNDFHILLRRFFKTPAGFEQFESIIAAYRELQAARGDVEKEEIKSQKIFIKTQFDIENFKNHGWQYPGINFLKKEADKKLSDFISVFLIHGSFATKDFLPQWSDLDALIILNDKTFENTENLKYVYKTLRKMALLCYKIDPLAHHEFEFLTEFDLNHYPQYMFPLAIYDYSILLSGKSEFDIILRADNGEKIQRLSDFVNYFHDKIANSDFSRNKYSWKNDLSRAMLWPSLLLQAKNIFIYKKYSFSKAKNEFKNLDFSPIDEASSIMREWKNANFLKYYPNIFLNLLPYRLNQKMVYLYRHLARSCRPSETAERIEKLTREFLTMMESGLKYITGDLQNGN